MLQARLAELARIGATENGIDRALFTPAEHAARRLFARWAREAGFAVVQDRAGNVFARLVGGDDGPAVQCGSHLDTVRGGGAYDGAYGVVGGLTALERLATLGVPPRSIEVAAWAGEEGSRFPLGCLGSSMYAGLVQYDELEALVADDGAQFAEALSGPNGLLEDVPVRDDFPTPTAYVELHIEQGPVMERAGARLGVVTVIAGQRRLRVRIVGTAGHAGTVPMAARADALCAASEIVLAAEQAARDAGETVATVGHLVVEPNQTNIIPGYVTLRIDARSVDDDRLASAVRVIREQAAEIAERRGVTVTFETLESRAAVPMDTTMRGHVHAVCFERDPKAIELPSGAGHDAMCIAQIAPAAMIFVPSIGGRSHVGDERTAPEDLELGVDALAATLLLAAR